MDKRAPSGGTRGGKGGCPAPFRAGGGACGAAGDRDALTARSAQLVGVGEALWSLARSMKSVGATTGGTEL